jgi:hypothetical protein
MGLLGIGGRGFTEGKAIAHRQHRSSTYYTKEE